MASKRRRSQRIIDPSYWNDREFCLALSRDARHLYAGMWCYADNQGCIEVDFHDFKYLLFPYDDDVDVKRVEELFNELVKEKRALVYDVEGHKIAWLSRLLLGQPGLNRITRDWPLPTPEDIVGQLGRRRAGEFHAKIERIDRMTSRRDVTRSDGSRSVATRADGSARLANTAKGRVSSDSRRITTDHDPSRRITTDRVEEEGEVEHEKEGEVAHARSRDPLPSSSATQGTGDRSTGRPADKPIQDRISEEVFNSVVRIIGGEIDEEAAELLRQWYDVDRFHHAWISFAVLKAERLGKPLSYAGGILRDLRKKGGPTPEDLRDSGKPSNGRGNGATSNFSSYDPNRRPEELPIQHDPMAYTISPEEVERQDKARRDARKREAKE
jgi:hypothetical protein